MKARKCRKCGKSNAKVKFQPGKNLCNQCKSQDTKTKRLAVTPPQENGRPKRTITGLTKLPEISDSAFDFSDPAALRERFGKDLAFGVSAQRDTMLLNRQRLNVAIESGHATDIKDAESAYRRSTAEYNSMLMRMADMIEGFGDPQTGRDVEFPDVELSEEANVVDVASYKSEHADCDTSS